MPIRSKLTERDPNSSSGQSASGGSSSGSSKREPTEEEKAVRKQRVVAGKDALARSNGLKGEHVAPARAALKGFLQRLNEPRQPDDAQFEALLEGPFRAPPKKKEQRRF
jgi:hypothetical protein